MAGSRGRKDEPPRGGAAPDAAAFAALFLGLRDTIQRDGAAVLPNAELYAWVLDALARDVARQGRIPDVPYHAPASTAPVPACGNRLDEFLAKRDLTKTALARQVGVSRYGLTKIARGTSRPGYDLAHAIARALDVDVTVVFPPKTFGAQRKEGRSRRRRRSSRPKRTNNPEK